MKFNDGDRVVHDIYGIGTVQISGVNGVCQVAFDSDSIMVVKTSELAKAVELKK